MCIFNYVTSSYCKSQVNIWNKQVMSSTLAETHVSIRALLQHTSCIYRIKAHRSAHSADPGLDAHFSAPAMVPGCAKQDVMPRGMICIEPGFGQASRHSSSRNLLAACKGHL